MQLVGSKNVRKSTISWPERVIIVLFLYHFQRKIIRLRLILKIPHFFLLNFDCANQIVKVNKIFFNK